jgi:putative DNA primase/helicase
LSYDFAAAIYSTHKHSKKTPRYRLIIPLSRHVSPDEYQAISRKLAEKINIELFDPTTFQPERLMYFPSISTGADFVFDYQDGAFLNPDEILNLYHDWRDSSAWAMSSKVDKIVVKSMQKAGDPLEKPGIIGAFCRTYSISEAIETFLSDVYESTVQANRYTFRAGSCAGGLVLYDDKFAFSHHSTDPAGEKLSNAFDLVRLHLFGSLDKDADENTPINKRASFEAMQRFASNDSEVKMLIGAERLAGAAGDFEPVDTDEPQDEQNSEWTAELATNRNGGYLSTIDNLVLILLNDPTLKGAIGYDEFENRPVALKNFPWRKISHKTRYLIDRDDANIEHYIERVYGINCGAKLEKAMAVIYEKKKFHPVRDYLDALTWDGVERVDRLIIDHMGAQDCDYVKAITRKTLCAAVARIYQPGVKFDNMLVFVGRQGLGKSSLIGKLGGEWFSDSFATIQGREAFEQLQGVWLVEVAELAGLRKAEAEHIKHYISKREDRYRVAYGRRVENFPRQCVFFGSTNRTDFLRDPTGNRRFWPVQLSDGAKKSVFNITKDEINQIWAEAVELYQQGETLFLPKELEAEAQKIQEQHSENDDREGIIRRYLETLLPENWEEMDIYRRRSFLNGDDEISPIGTIRRDKVCAAEIWAEAIGGMPKDMTSQNTKFIHDTIRKLDNWREADKKQRFGFYGILKGYERLKTGKNFVAASVAASVAAVLPQSEIDLPDEDMKI